MNPVTQPIPELFLAQLMNRSPLTVPLHTPLLDAIALMNQHSPSSNHSLAAEKFVHTGLHKQDSQDYVLVVDGTQLAGIFTAQDIVKLVAAGKNLSDFQIREVMTQPVITLTLSETLTPQHAIERFQQYSIHHLPVLDTQGKLVGLITANHLLSIQNPDQSESQLQTYTTELEHLYNDAPCGYHSLDAEGTFVQINDTELAMLGYRREEVLGKKFPELLAPESLLIFEQNFPQFKERGWVQDLRFQLVCKDGRLLPVSLSATAIKDAAGNYYASRSVVIDISERVRWEAERQTVEATLKVSEERYRLLSEISPVGLFRNDLTGNCTYVNERTLHLLGHPLPNCLGRNWLNTLHPDDRQWVAASFQDFIARSAIQPTTIHQFECRHLHPDGAVVWVLVNIVPERDSTGRITGYIGTLTDVTDRKHLELALQRNEEQLRLALELNGIGSWDWQISNNSVSWDDNHFRVLGYRPGAVEPSYKNWRDRVHPDDLALTEQKLKQALETQTDYDDEFRIILDDGHIRWLASKGHGLYDELGQPVRMVGVEFDISDRKEAEAQKAFQSFLLNQVQNAVIATDLEGHITYWNQFAQQLYQLTPEDIGRLMLEVMVPVQQQEVVQQRIASIQEKGTWEGELEVQRRDGSRFTASIIDSLLRDPAGNPCGMVGISMDITAQKQLEAQFLRAQRLESLGTLASGIAHDLNNILTPILVFAQLLPATLPPLSERNQTLLTMLDENAKRAADLVKQILTFARGMGGERAPVQVKHLLREVEQVMHSTFPKSLAITLAIATRDLWMVSADATQLHQVFMNFCVNARDAMPHGGTLRIAAENRVIDETYARMHLDAKAGSYIVISVTDTGTGISPEHLDRIFEPFFTTKAIGEGTGLGLSTALGIVRSHGGFVSVYSEVGKGTQFNVFLPTIEGRETPAESRQKTIMGRGELILVVDDEANIRESLKLILESLNYQVLLAKDGIEAIAYYVEHREDIYIVVMDMMMPEMDGLTAIQALQKINPQIKVIATSGLGGNYQQAVQSLGIATLLVKPFTTTQLLHSLEIQYPLR
jgi:PAS domain S-box-containing protein